MGKNKTARTTFRAFCPRCSRGPFVINKSGTIRKHACWTKLSESDMIRTSEQAERDATGAAVCRAVIAQRARANRIDALKIMFAIATLLIAVLGSCH